MPALPRSRTSDKRNTDMRILFSRKNENKQRTRSVYVARGANRAETRSEKCRTYLGNNTGGLVPDDHGLFHHEVGAPHVLEVVDVAPADAHGAYLVWFEKGEKGFIWCGTCETIPGSSCCNDRVAVE